MRRWCALALASALSLLVCINEPAPAAALDFQIANPVTQSNMSVYFVDGNGPAGGSELISLDEAAARDQVKIYQQRSVAFDDASHQNIYVNGPVAVENLSGQTIFLQLGALVRGGLQDQVVARTTLIPPGSGRVSIDTLCVDPFRSTARDGESAELFSAPSALLPWRLAKLNALAANSESATVLTAVRDVRQLGVWWSIDSLRAKLAQRLGVPLEPTTAAHWSDIREDSWVNTLLASRRSPWKNSLPMSLENPELALAEKPYVNTLEAKGESNGKIIGAIFVINGQIAGADIYRSHALFRQMWPQLLRAYAAEALAQAGSKPAAPPTVRSLRAFLAAAERDPARDLDLNNQIHESNAGIYASTAGGDGAWVYRSYVPRFATDRLAPEGVVVNLLETGKVDGRAIASLDQSEMVVVRPDRAPGRFAGAIVDAPKTAASDDDQAASADAADASDRWSASVERNRDTGASGLTVINLAVLFAAALVFYLAKRNRRVKSKRQTAMAAPPRKRRATPPLPALPPPLPQPESANTVSLSAQRRRRAARVAAMRTRTALPFSDPARRSRAA